MIEKCYVIPTQKKCNSNCVFCISKTRNYCKSKEYLEINSKFYNKIKELKHKGIKKFEITGGGEPFLNAKLEEIVKIIKFLIPDSYIKLYTNGDILKAIPLVDEINISVVHQNSNINNLFMNSCNNISLREKLLFFKNSNSNTKLRISLALLKGAIDTKEKLELFVAETTDLVSEYVVRTIYPNTPNYNKLYVDIDYNNSKVVFEKDNNVKEFDGIILWSDGNLYTDWSLQTERNFESYLLLKPDSKTYINEIENMIIMENFEINKKLLIEDFVNQILPLYSDKTPEYLKLVKRHLELISRLFGNKGIILFLNKEIEMQRLVDETLKLKNKIRNEYSLTHAHNAFILTNEGQSHLNMVHCPDNEISLFNRDINLINSMNKTELTDSDWQLVKKYRSYNI